MKQNKNNMIFYSKNVGLLLNFQFDFLQINNILYNINIYIYVN